MSCAVPHPTQTSTPARRTGISAKSLVPAGTGSERSVLSTRHRPASAVSTIVTPARFERSERYSGSSETGTGVVPSLAAAAAISNVSLAPSKVIMSVNEGTVPYQI
jgi:hypothetical protein